MARPLSPIHRPLSPGEVESVTSGVPSRIALLEGLDRRSLSGRTHMLGPGGASAAFSRAVDRALAEEIADQLRGRPMSGSEIGLWAAEIIAAFKE